MKTIILLLFSATLFVSCKPKYSSPKTAAWPANEDRFRDKDCKDKSQDECSCKLAIAEKFSKSYENYEEMVITNNDSSSDFWREFQKCSDKYSQNKDAKQNQSFNTDNNTKKGWSTDDRNQAMNDCIGKPSSDKGHSAEICNCMISKAEVSFSSYSEMKRTADNNVQFQNSLKDCEAVDKGSDQIKPATPVQENSWTEEEKAKFKKIMYNKGMSDALLNCYMDEALKYFKSYNDWAFTATGNTEYINALQQCLKEYKH